MTTKEYKWNNGRLEARFELAKSYVQDFDFLATTIEDATEYRDMANAADFAIEELMEVVKRIRSKREELTREFMTSQGIEF